MQYLVLQYGQENDRMALRELTDLPNVHTVIWHHELSSFWQRALRKIHTHRHLNSLWALPGRDRWHKDVLVAVRQMDCLIVLAYCLTELDDKFLKRLRHERPQLKVVLLLWDSLNTHSPMMELVRPRILGYDWDLVISFDRGDCAEHGWVWLGTHYYSRTLDIEPVTQASDLCFVGAATVGRLDLLDAISRELRTQGCKCDFTLVLPCKALDRLRRKLGGGKSVQFSSAGVCLTQKTLSYRGILAKTLASDCILELVQPGQATQTLRYFEAVVYNKKLLTNNPNIRKLPFYDERYMRVFSSPSDIDVAWLQGNNIVDYKYSAQFSPVYILELIEANIGREAMTC